MDTAVYDPAYAFADEALSSPAALAAVLDHTLLRPEATRREVMQLCEEAADYRFACAMVNPCWVPEAVSALTGTGVGTGVVIGFPLGAGLTATKLDEARRVLLAGAHDVDTVLNVGWLKSGMERELEAEVRALAEVTHASGGVLKVILETALLGAEEKRRASELAVGAGADFIKTSTGFAAGGATVEDVRMMRTVAGERCGVKASGGVRSLADATTMLRAGASRIGASACVRIVTELRAQLGGEALVVDRAGDGY